MVYLGILTVAMGGAFVATLCFESPFISLEKIVLGAIFKRPQRQKATEDPKTLYNKEEVLKS